MSSPTEATSKAIKGLINLAWTLKLLSASGADAIAQRLLEGILSFYQHLNRRSFLGSMVVNSWGFWQGSAWSSAVALSGTSLHALSSPLASLPVPFTAVLLVQIGTSSTTRKYLPLLPTPMGLCLAPDLSLESSRTQI